MLNSGLTNSNVEKRTKAVRELGLLNDDKEAEDAALAALKDDKPDVRAAAAQSLGDMSAVSAKPQLLEALHDNDVAVILSAAHSLVTMGDERGYNVFYAVLTGEQKSGASLKEQQKKMLSDPKKLAGLGFEAGLGFVPFGGMGLTAFKVLTKDDVSPVLAAAALTLGQRSRSQKRPGPLRRSSRTEEVAGARGGLRRYRQTRRSHDEGYRRLRLAGRAA